MLKSLERIVREPNVLIANSNGFDDYGRVSIPTELWSLFEKNKSIAYYIVHKYDRPPSIEISNIGKPLKIGKENEIILPLSELKNVGLERNTPLVFICLQDRILIYSATNYKMYKDSFGVAEFLLNIYAKIRESLEMLIKPY